MIVLAIHAALLLLNSLLLGSNKRISAVAGSIIMFVVLALRSELYGADALYYLNGYDYISSLTYEQMIESLSTIPLINANLIYPFSFENGWVVLNWVFSALNLGYRSLFIVLSAITAICFGRFAFRYSPAPAYSLFVSSCMSFFLYSIFILRQTLALCVCLESVKAILDKKPVRFILYLLIASSFHRSAIIFGVLYILSQQKKKKKIYITGIILFLSTILISATVLPAVVSILFSLLGKAHFQVSFSFNNLILVQLIMYLSLSLFDIDGLSENPKTNIILWAMLISLTSYALMLNNEQLARANEYYWVFVTLLIPLLIQQLEPHLQLLGTLVVTIALFGFLALQVAGSSLDPFIFAGWTDWGI